VFLQIFDAEVLVTDEQIEDVEDEHRNAERVMLAMKENLAKSGCSSQSSSFQSGLTGFTSSTLPFASSSVSSLFYNIYLSYFIRQGTHTIIFFVR